MTNLTILGCGYVGKALAQHWRSGVVVTATTTRPERVAELDPIAAQVRVVRGDDAAGVRSLLQDQEVVIVSVGAPSAAEYEATYLQTAKALASVVQEAPTLKQLIYTGSYAVYGDRDGKWVDETTPVAPANRNGEILAETEQVLLSLSHLLRVCLFRLGGIYGPGRELVKIFRRVAGTTRPGTGEDAANWVHLTDIVAAIEFAYQHQLSGIYNLVGTVPLTSKVLLDRVCAAHHLEPISWDSTQPSSRPYNARVSNQKLRDAGYRFVYPEIDVMQ